MIFFLRIKYVVLRSRVAVLNERPYSVLFEVASLVNAISYSLNGFDSASKFFSSSHHELESAIS